MLPLIYDCLLPEDKAVINQQGKGFGSFLEMSNEQSVTLLWFGVDLCHPIATSHNELGLV